jgi:hypothetical protein
MCQTISLAAELVKFAPVNSKFDAAALCSILDVEEETLFRECLGFEFYEALYKDLKTVPDATTFVELKTYTAGEFVIVNGLIYECLVGGSYYNVTNANFKPIKKFNNENYQIFWERYLGKLISWRCFYSIVVYKAIDFTNTGLMRNKTEYSDAANTKEISFFKHEFEGDMRDLFANMDAFLRRNASLYPLYKPNMASGNCGCEPDTSCGTLRKKGFAGFNLNRSKNEHFRKV